MTICCDSDKESLQHQLCRIRTNWIYFMMIASLYAISYTSISSSFHQFITNPNPEEVEFFNRTEKIEVGFPDPRAPLTDLKVQGAIIMIQPGLGESELFYSWVIALFNIGALVGAVGSGFLVKHIPYWHLVLGNLLMHTIGYILYAISQDGVVIMVSKFLSGIFIGGEMTLALSYFAESSVAYEKIYSQLGRKTDAGTIRRSLFAWHNVGVGIGYIIGPGTAAVFSLFDIDQFRSIAWFNVAFGMAFVFLELLMFHGENKFKNFKSKCKSWNAASRMSCFKLDCTEVMILIFLILCRGVLSFRFGVYETIYNPVLSDYFGFDEIFASYFFFALVTSQISGTILLLILQQIKLNSHIIAIIGLTMSVASCVLLADWQAIGNDECTNFSPYHHSALKLNSTAIVVSAQDIETEIYLQENALECNSTFCYKDCYLMGNSSISFSSRNYQTNNGDDAYSLCTDGNSYYVQMLPSRATDVISDVSNSVYRDAAMSLCENSVVEGSYCHWTPNSLVTRQHCNDCKPICRSTSKSLNFAQFCFGAALLMLSIPVAWVPVASMASERTNSDLQGIVMGVVVALTAIGRTISPLWLDAAYEGMMKRTFLAMIIMIVTHLPFLLIFIIFYRKFNPRPHLNYDKLQTYSSEESSTDYDSTSGDESGGEPYKLVQ